MCIDKKWENEYINKEASDCPYCGVDRPEHVCRRCSSDMSHEICWANDGFCSQECVEKENIEVESVKKNREIKKTKDIKCECDISYCGKCLGGGCKDIGCPTHTDEMKRRWLNNKKK